MNARDILTTAIGNSFRSRLRTTLTVIAIVIGAFTLTITNALGAGVNDYIDNQVASIGAPDVMNVSKPVAARAASDGPQPYVQNAPAEVSTNVGPPGTKVIGMTDADLDAIRGIDGITSAEPLVAVQPDYVEWSGHGKFVLAVSPLSAGVRVDLAAGSLFDQGSTNSQLIIPTTYVSTLGFASHADAVGEVVQIGVTNALRQQTTVEATIVGVQEPTLFGANPTLNETLTTTLFDAQNVGIPTGADQQYSSATARFDPAATKDQVAVIKQRLVDAGFAGTTVTDQIGTFQAVIDGIVLVLNAFAVIALLAAGFGIINTLLMSVQERTREIGLMKAMGMSGARIFALFSTEAVFIGFLGSAIGALLAIGVGGLVSRVASAGPLKDLVGLHILTFTPSAIIAVLLLVMAIAFIASVLPAARAARQSPIDSLRYE